MSVKHQLLEGGNVLSTSFWREVTRQARPFLDRVCFTEFRHEGWFSKFDFFNCIAIIQQHRLFCNSYYQSLKRVALKSDFHLPKKLILIVSMKALKNDETCFYFMLRALHILKISKFLSWFFWLYTEKFQDLWRHNLEANNSNKHIAQYLKTWRQIGNQISRPIFVFWESFIWGRSKWSARKSSARTYKKKL